MTEAEGTLVKDGTYDRPGLGPLVAERERARLERPPDGRYYGVKAPTSTAANECLT